MTDVLTRWIQNKLGLYIPHEPGDQEFNKDVANGRLIGEILRKYNIISDDQYIALQKDKSIHFAVCNMSVLHRSLKESGFLVNDEEILAVIRGVSGAATQLLYRLYLWLEIPKSRSAPIPMGERGDCCKNTFQGGSGKIGVSDQVQNGQCTASGDCPVLKPREPQMGKIGIREPQFNPALLVHVRTSPLTRLDDTSGACSIGGTARSEADGPTTSSVNEHLDENDMLPFYQSKLARDTARMDQYLFEMAEFDRAVCLESATDGRWTEYEQDDGTEYGISAWENFRDRYNEKRKADDQRQTLYEKYTHQQQQQLDSILITDFENILLSPTHRKSAKEETMERLLSSSRNLKKIFADHIGLRNAEVLAEEQYLSSLTTGDRMGKESLISEFEQHECEVSTAIASLNKVQEEFLKKTSATEKPEETLSLTKPDEEEIFEE